MAVVDVLWSLGFLAACISRSNEPPPATRRFGLWSIRPNASVAHQDLKDFGREAGNISFADIDRDTPGQGYVFPKLFYL